MKSIKTLRTYLSGSIDRIGGQIYPFWTKYEEDVIYHFFDRIGFAIEILNPNDESYQNNTAQLFQSELAYIEKCNFILVELSVRRGIGVGVEMYHAYINEIPIFAICPNYSYYQNKEWVHPYVLNLSDKMFPDLDATLAFLSDKKLLNSLIKDKRIN